MINLRKSVSGFTIVELLVSIAVGAIVIASLNQLVSGYLHVSQRGRYLSLANSYVEGKVEALRNIGYNSLVAGSYSLTSQLPSQLPPSRSGTMQITAPATGLKQIDITLSYQDQGLTNSYSYTTYIGELGVGQ
ncbi:MAG TPA: prepilin-type N-terminal cleavage/methylation domain-containing protein [Candidatus Dormibacteraeota bacterium]|nr:prepilin-type N-terminal cleavage/methylation domain-containing protein [Candidatus Dormibacteraeota bacterium]